MTNSNGQPIGIIERDALIMMIKKNCWYNFPEGEEEYRRSFIRDQDDVIAAGGKG